MKLGDRSIDGWMMMLSGYNKKEGFTLFNVKIKSALKILFSVGRTLEESLKVVSLGSK